MLKPQNIVQAAQADFVRKRRNTEQARYRDPSYEPYAFHRDHVRKSESPRGLLILALMNPQVKTAKPNTKMIYGNAALLLDAIRSCSPEESSG